MVKISNIDRDGHYLWTLDGEKLGAGVDGRRKGKNRRDNQAASRRRLLS